jgi:hypothetical protein
LASPVIEFPPNPYFWFCLNPLTISVSAMKVEAVTPDHDDVVAESFSEPDEPYEELLVALYESLSGSLKESSRQLLRDTLRGRIERIADSEKRNATVRKIAERLGDTEYWINYANKLSDG